jgi:hypothetical protein
MRWYLSSALILLAAVPAIASPLDPKAIDAEAKWYVHIDLDAARASKLGGHVRKEMTSRLAEFPWLQNRIEEEIARVGFDPFNDLHGVTSYGRTLEHYRSVLVINANANREKLTTELKKKADYQTLRYNDHELHSWVDRKGKDVEVPVALAFAGDSKYVIGRSLDAVKLALDILDGKQASLKSENIAVPSDAILYVKATGLADAKLPKHSAILQQAEQISLSLRNTDGQLQIATQVVTIKPETAQQMKSVVDGMRALVELKAADEECVKFALGGLQASVKDSTFDIEWKVSDDQLLTLVDKRKDEIRHHFEKKWKHGKPH